MLYVLFCKFNEYTGDVIFFLHTYNAQMTIRGFTMNILKEKF